MHDPLERPSTHLSRKRTNTLVERELLASLLLSAYHQHPNLRHNHPNQLPYLQHQQCYCEGEGLGASFGVNNNDRPWDGKGTLPYTSVSGKVQAGPWAV